MERRKERAAPLDFGGEVADGRLTRSEFVSYHMDAFGALPLVSAANVHGDLKMV